MKIANQFLVSSALCLLMAPAGAQAAGPDGSEPIPERPSALILAQAEDGEGGEGGQGGQCPPGTQPSSGGGCVAPEGAGEQAPPEGDQGTPEGAAPDQQQSPVEEQPAPEEAAPPEQPAEEPSMPAEEPPAEEPPVPAEEAPAEPEPSPDMQAPGAEEAAPDAAQPQDAPAVEEPPAAEGGAQEPAEEPAGQLMEGEEPAVEGAPEEEGQATPEDAAPQAQEEEDAQGRAEDCPPGLEFSNGECVPVEEQAPGEQEQVTPPAEEETGEPGAEAEGQEGAGPDEGVTDEQSAPDDAQAPEGEEEIEEPGAPEAEQPAQDEGAPADEVAPGADEQVPDGEVSPDAAPEEGAPDDEVAPDAGEQGPDGEVSPDGAPEDTETLQDQQAPEGEQPAGEGEQEPAAEPGPDDQVQEDRVDPQEFRTEIQEIVEEEGQRIELGQTPEDIRVRRAEIFQRREEARVVEEYNDNRTIVEINNNIYVESPDYDRIVYPDDEVYYEELPRGRIREVVERGDGTRIVTVRNRYGDVIRRVRVAPDGREYVLVYVPEERYDTVLHLEDVASELPPFELTIPMSEYVLEADRVEDPDRYYAFLQQPPVEEVPRLYSLQEVKYSERVRDMVRRIDLDTVEFEFGSARIEESEIADLEAVANAMLRILEENPAETFLIEGHTDAVGSETANLALSDRRADAVARALTNVFDIPPENLAVQGYGEQFLKVDTQEPERENRRVAIRRITPLVTPVASAQ